MSSKRQRCPFHRIFHSGDGQKLPIQIVVWGLEYIGYKKIICLVNTHDVFEYDYLNLTSKFNHSSTVLSFVI